MRNRLRIGIIAWLIFSLTGCLRATLPISRLDSPETPGDTWKFRAGVGVGGADNVIVVTDPSARPPTTNQPTLDNTGTTIPARISTGLGERFELGLKGPLNGGPFLLEGKWQFIGQSAQKSGADTFSMALTIAGGADNQTQSGGQKGIGGPTGFNWNATMTNAVFDAALIAGYHLSTHWLLFGGPFFTKYTISGNIHNDLSSDSSSPAGDYGLTGGGQHFGANLAAQTAFSDKKNFFLTFELAAANLQWTGTPGKGGLFGGALVEWVF